MTLRERVVKLKLTAAAAMRHAQWWEKQIQEHGEQKAEEFYLHLGLNHIEKKGFDFEGLTLSREPNEHEKLCVKGIAAAQETEKEKINKILLQLREELISDGLKGISKLDPADYHTLVLQVPAGISADLRDRLIKTHKHGRMLVAQELGGTSMPKGYVHSVECNRRFIKNDPPGYQCDLECKADDDEDEIDELDTLTDVTTSRVANDVQSRMTSSAARWVLAGLSGAALMAAIQKDMDAGSVSYIDRSAAGAANTAIGAGRLDEMQRRADEIDRYEQSELLDQNTCGPCAEDDGKTADDPEDLPGAPNPSCEGGDQCRGFIVAIRI